MKTILVALAFLLCSSFTFAGDKPVKYEVEFSGKYNAVSIEQAQKIVGELIKQHQSACKMRVVIQKPTDNLTNLLLMSTNANDVIFTDALRDASITQLEEK
jgi:hypothetical protein